MTSKRIVVQNGQVRFSLCQKNVVKCDVKKWRFVVDFRQFNNETSDNKFPLPNVKDTLDALSASINFSK